MAQYFPKNRIEDSKYTNGDKFTTGNTGKPYVGYYYETYDGRYKTGKNPMEGPSYDLIPNPIANSNTSLSLTENNVVYSALSSDRGKGNFKIYSLKDPLSFYPKPTPQDYSRGYFTRYVAKRRNSPNSIFLEIDQPTHLDLQYKRGVYNYVLWDSISIFWQITGPLKDNKENKDFPRAGIINTNERILKSKELAFPSLSKFFLNPTQFAVLESLEVISGQYTSGGELVYRTNDKDYIGYYHVRGNGDIFDGATFVQSSNMLLKPINTTVAGSISLLLDKTLKELRTQYIAGFAMR